MLGNSLMWCFSGHSGLRQSGLNEILFRFLPSCFVGLFSSFLSELDFSDPAPLFPDLLEPPDLCGLYPILALATSVRAISTANAPILSLKYLIFPSCSFFQPPRNILIRSLNTGGSNL